MNQPSAPPGQRFHGTEPPRGLDQVAGSPLFQGRFGRMFRNLPSLIADDDLLIQLASTMVEPSDLGSAGFPTSAQPATGSAASGSPSSSSSPGGQDAPDPFDNPAISAGYTYLGQFIDHDITFDPNSKLQRENDPNALRDFRTPRFDLDSVYGRGPDDQPYLYDDDGMHLRIGKTGNNEDDLPRTSPVEGLPRRALIGDPRNDENVIVSQIQLATLKFHNRVVDHVANENRSLSPGDLLNQARQLVRWHYQWVVIHDFLATIVGEDLVEAILHPDTYQVNTAVGPREAFVARPDLKFFHWTNNPYMPVEFSAAAYRFGHSMVRPEYELNQVVKDRPIFSSNPNAGEFDDLRGFRERPPAWIIEWHRFFPFSTGNEAELQRARLIDTKLAPGLSTLPPGVVSPSDPHKALAERNLLRGKALGLPSGQVVARYMGIPEDLILSGDALGLSGDVAIAFNQDTPLWFYILKEAEVLAIGNQLGPVGGRIVAEVLIGLLAGDPSSYLSIQPHWRPTLLASQKETFTMADLLTFAEVQI